MEKTSFKIIDNQTISKLVELDNQIKTIEGKVFSYGTAGFRYEETLLNKVAFRTGIAVSLLSMRKKSQPYGVMVTASHNLYKDNGIKIAGDKGEIIPKDEEDISVEIVNSKNLADTIKKISAELHLEQLKSVVVVGYDTRRSGKPLCDLIMKALACFEGCDYKCYDVVTTPCLHLMTLYTQVLFSKRNPNIKFAFPGAGDYWKFLKGSYERFNAYYDKLFPNQENKKYENEINIDCSNGISALFTKEIAEIFSSNQKIKLSFINTDTKTYEKLNSGCGAEVVHKERKYPSEMDTSVTKHISFDGDVDRIMYYPFIKDQKPPIKLVDGDHLLVLYATTLNFLIEKLSASVQKRFFEEIKFGVAITAYANGGLMSYVKEKLSRMTMEIGKTGVKHLHAIAKKYDIAIYFEANGHGTVYSSEKVNTKFEKLNCFVESSRDCQILELIQYYIAMFNTTVGDALSSLIATETALRIMDMSLEDVLGFYNELESVNYKMAVKDKNIFIPNDNETKLLKPEEVQKSIDELCSKIEKGRCFVRPSGTEDVVRIYAEGKTMKEVEEMIEKVKEMLVKY